MEDTQSTPERALMGALVDIVGPLARSAAEAALESDTLGDRIRSEIGNIDWSEEIDVDELLSEFEPSVDADDVEGLERKIKSEVEDQIRDQISDLNSRIDDLEGREALDKDDLATELTSLAESFPEERSQRCALGEAVTDVILTVLRENATLVELSERLASLEQPVQRDVEPDVVPVMVDEGAVEMVAAPRQPEVILHADPPHTVPVPPETGHLFTALNESMEVWPSIRMAAADCRASAIAERDAYMTLATRLESLVRSWHDLALTDPTSLGDARLLILLRAGSLHRVDWTVLAREVLRKVEPTL